MIEPHGGRLVDRYVVGEEALALQEQARRLPKVTLDARQLSDIQMIGQGAFSPLEGFMGQEEYRSVLTSLHLPGGLPWTLPVVLAVDRDVASPLREGTEVALTTEEGEVLGLLYLRERYVRDREQEARQVFRTTDRSHPGVQVLSQQGEVVLAGPVLLLGPPPVPQAFARYFRSPSQTRQEFQRQGWRTVVGFQTRNPVHRAHEYIQKCALETVDGLLLHPLVGETKEGDLPASVRMRCYEELLQHYFPPARVLLSVLPAYMRYAGPREAIFHAIVRKNYGCTHFIVGRDHAGVGNYYGPYDAHRIFQEFDPRALGITPLFFENAFFCKRCGGMASERTCPHGADERVNLSGTQVRALLAQGQAPPPEFTRPEVARVLAEVFARTPEGASVIKGP